MGEKGDELKVSIVVVESEAWPTMRARKAKIWVRRWGVHDKT